MHFQPKLFAYVKKKQYFCNRKSEMMVLNDPKINTPILRMIGETADQLGLECYVIGGWVRDLILHRESTDIDVVVIGSGITLAEAEMQSTSARRVLISLSL